MDVNNTFGAWFIGAEVSLVAFGFSILQCWIFFQQWRSEHFMLKIVVILTLILGFLLVFLTSHALYHYLITSIGNPAGLTQLIWSFNAEPWVSEATITLTHLFYTFRIFSINKSYVLCALLFAMTIAHTVVDLLAAGLELSNPGLAAAKLTAKLAQAGLSLDLALDIIIMISMFHFFYTNRTHIRSTQSLLNKLMLYTFASGSLTVVADAVILAMFIALPTTQIYSGASFVLPHLYSNCLLALLNSRRYLRARYDTKTASSSDKPTASIDGVSPSLPMFTVSKSEGGGGVGTTTTSLQFGTFTGTSGLTSDIYPIEHVKDESHGESLGAGSSHEFVPMAI